MKPISLLCIPILFLAFSSKCQVKEQPFRQQFHTVPTAAGANLRGTAARERIVAVHYRYNEFTALDSIVRYYEDSLCYIYNVPSRGMTVTGDSLGRYMDDVLDEATVQYDTLYIYQYNSRAVIYRLYNSANDVIRHANLPLRRYSAEYIAPGQCTLRRYVRYDTLGAVAKSEITYRQLVNGVSVQDSIFDSLAQKPLSRVLFTYNTTNKCLSGTKQIWDSGWKNWERNLYTYDTGSKLTVYQYQGWDTSMQNWHSFEVDSMIYPTNGVAYDSVKVYLSISFQGSLELLYRNYAHINAAGLHDTIYYNRVPVSWFDDSKTYKVLLTHTAYNHLERYDLFYFWNNQYDIVPTYQYKFYYQLHDIPSVIAKIPVSTYRLYPNPAFETLTIEGKSALKTKIAMSDVLGRNVLCVQLDLQKSRQTIDLSHLQTGIYLYKILTENGEILSNGKIEKR